MGKGYNNYMCKKPFHPGSKANIKRAWMAEQKTDNEKKKQEELKLQYEKEQDLYNNRALLSNESKDKLELNFMYEAPPGAKRERQKEDDEPEYKFEWQRKYNAPREDYAKGNADIKDQPFGIPVRNVRCIKCHKWGHINTDKECPLYTQASASSMPTTSIDPMELMKQMREDGYGLKQNVLGHHLNTKAANQQLIPSDESDPEMEFLNSLSVADKKKLLRKLKKLSKKQEKSSNCKKKKSKKTKKSKSSDKTGNSKKSKKTKKASSDESSTESSSDSSSSSDEKHKSSEKFSATKSKKRRETSKSESGDEKPKHLSKHKRKSKGKSGTIHIESEATTKRKKVKSESSTIGDSDEGKAKVEKDIYKGKTSLDKTSRPRDRDNEKSTPSLKHQKSDKRSHSYEQKDGDESKGSHSGEKNTKESRGSHSEENKAGKQSGNSEKETSKHKSDHSRESKHRHSASVNKALHSTEEEIENIKKHTLDSKEKRNPYQKSKRKSEASVSERKKRKDSEAEKSPDHPDGFSHTCPQARIEANYLQAEIEYKGICHDDFRYSNRDRRSPSVKQKYNN